MIQSDVNIGEQPDLKNYKKSFHTAVDSWALTGSFHEAWQISMLYFKILVVLMIQKIKCAATQIWLAVTLLVQIIVKIISTIIFMPL